MADAHAPFGAPGRVARGDLWGGSRAALRAAQRVGALEPIQTETFPAHDGGIPFVVRVASALAARQRRLAARSDDRSANPFLPADPS